MKNMTENELLKQKNKLEKKKGFWSVCCDVRSFFMLRRLPAIGGFIVLIGLPLCFLTNLGFFVLGGGLLLGLGSYLTQWKSIGNKENCFVASQFNKKKYEIDQINKVLNEEYGYNFRVYENNLYVRPHPEFDQDKLTDEQLKIINSNDPNLLNSLREKMKREEVLNQKKRIAYINARTHGKNHKEAMKISQEINMDNNVDGDNNITI